MTIISLRAFFMPVIGSAIPPSTSRACEERASRTMQSTTDHVLRTLYVVHGIMKGADPWTPIYWEIEAHALHNREDVDGLGRPHGARAIHRSSRERQKGSDYCVYCTLSVPSS